jgi:hypothetical protein
MIGRHRGKAAKTPAKGNVDTIQIGGMLMEPVITGFKMHIRKYEKAGCHADSQPEDINDRKHLALEQVPISHLKIVPDHNQHFVKPLKQDAAIAIN